MELKASLGGCKTGGLTWAESAPREFPQVGRSGRFITCDVTGNLYVYTLSAVVTELLYEQYMMVF